LIRNQQHTGGWEATDARPCPGNPPLAPAGRRFSRTKMNCDGRRSSRNTTRTKVQPFNSRVCRGRPTEAMKLTLINSSATAAMLNCPIEEEQLQRLNGDPMRSLCTIALGTALRSRTTASGYRHSCSEAARGVGWRGVKKHNFLVSRRFFTVWHAGC
jgi:hypothetical protein